MATVSCKYSSSCFRDKFSICSLSSLAFFKAASSESPAFTYRARAASILAYSSPTLASATFFPSSTAAFVSRSVTSSTDSNKVRTSLIKEDKTSLTKVSTLAVIFSNELPVASKSKATSFVSSAWEASKSSSTLPNSPVLPLTSSKFTEISFKVRIYCKPASSPGPPKISAIAVPTTALLSGSSSNLADTSCMI